LPSDWRNAVDGKTWHELLGPFSAKQVRIVCPPELPGVLESYPAGVSSMGQLPAPQRPDTDVKSGRENAYTTPVEAPPPSGPPVQSPLAHSHHSRSTESFVVIEAADSVPVADPVPAKRNWFRRTADRVRKRLGSHVCARS
jgi:hypothetical protein